MINCHISILCQKKNQSELRNELHCVCCGWETIDILLYISECESNPGYAIETKYERTTKTKKNSGLTNSSYHERPELIITRLFWKEKDTVNSAHSFNDEIYWNVKRVRQQSWEKRSQQMTKIAVVLCSSPLVLKTIRNQTRKSPIHSKYTENSHFSARTANKRTVRFISCRSKIVFGWTSFSNTSHTWHFHEGLYQHKLRMMRVEIWSRNTPSVVLDYLTEHLTRFTLEIRNRNLGLCNKVKFRF